MLIILREPQYIQNVIMQGSVFGSIMCTTVMDKLAKPFYSDKTLLYKYKNVVDVPILGMVDDLIGVEKCSANVVKSNATVNAFMDINKLKLSSM